MVSVSALFASLFWIGSVLLPFSTSPESGGVVSFGLPFYLLAAPFAVVLTLSRIDAIDKTAFLLSIGFILSIAIATLFAPSIPQSAARMVANVIGFFTFQGVLSGLNQGCFSANRIARVCLMSSFVLAIYFILNLVNAAFHIGLEAVIVERYVGGAMSLPWGASNTIAQVLLLSFVSFAIISDKQRIDYFMIAAISMAIVLTFSRSNIFLLLLVLPVVLGARFFVAQTVGVLFLVFGFLTFGDVDISRFDSFVADRIDPDAIISGNDRLQSMMEKLRFFADNPVGPIGYYGSLYYFELSAHNYWITTLVEQSLMGVVFSAFLFAYAAWRGFLKGNRIGIVFTIVMIALMVEDPQFTHPYIMMFWVALAQLISLQSVVNRRVYRKDRE